MSTEYGIVNDEGVVEGDFWSASEADAAILALPVDDREGLRVEPLCPTHREETAAGCEQCDEDDDDTASDFNQGDSV